jgi:CBS domain-containing protein
MSTPLECIGLEDDPIAFFEKHADVGFDCAPVKGDGKLLGMVYSKDATKPCAVASVMRPLHEVPLVSADTPIAALIRSMTGEDKHFWLVLDGIEINGIVTRSDLSKLPVRLLAITKIVHLEQLITQLLRKRIPGELWKGGLTGKRVDAIEQLLTQLRASNENTDVFECMGFSDKISVLKQVNGLQVATQVLWDANGLRNQLMHGREGGDDPISVSKFLEQLNAIDNQITHYRQQEACP